MVTTTRRIITTTAATTALSNNNSSSNGGARIINNNSHAAKRVRELIRIKQAGLCWYCQEKIEDGHTIVSRGKSTRYYYHDYCARNLNIIVQK